MTSLIDKPHINHPQKFSIADLFTFSLSHFPRWTNWVVRGIFGIIMISTFCLLISAGPLALMGLVSFLFAV